VVEAPCLEHACGCGRTLAAMAKQVKVAVVGVGNNISALVQGIALYRATGSLAGIRNPVLDGLGVGDIDFMAAFATSPDKIGCPFTGGLD
jgi:myo-inositol-1-phosphate synthase